MNPESRDRAARLARVPAMLLPVVLVVVILANLFGDSAARRHRWSFLEDVRVDVLGFRADVPQGGAWSIEQDASASGGRALVNRAGDPSAAATSLVASSVVARDVRATTRCRVAGAPGDGACGLVFRYVDVAGHHVARLETDTRKIVLARVVGGREHVLRSANADVAVDTWQELGIEARGDLIRVTWNGKPLLDAHDVLPAPVGSVGLWAPSRSEAYFDELAVDVLPAAPQAIELLPLFHKPS